MRCFVCQNELNELDFCTSCGTDVRVYKQIIYKSNRLYNEGLSKARVRDLSGAILCLNQSLKFNKNNIDARNLLGLCYFERGEVVSALSEWIISRGQQGVKNVADDYITAVQSNPSKMEVINETIKKYNQALVYCRQNSQDLAVIQLKKVLSLNENLIVGYQLLALIYMTTGEYEKARRTLLRAIRIDTNDTITQTYLKEVNRLLAEQMKDANGRSKVASPQEVYTYQNENDTIIQPVYAKEKRGFSSIINIVIGIVVGLAICWYLILPSRLKSAAAENDEKFIAVSEELAAEKANEQETLKQMESLQSEKDEVQNRLDELLGHNGHITEFDYLSRAAQVYMDDPGDSAQIMDNLSMIGEEYRAEATEDFIILYNKLAKAAEQKAVSDYVEAAKNAIRASDYNAAIDNYQKAWDLDQTNSDNLMGLAYAYRESGDTDTADELYRQVIRDFSETDNAMDARDYITNE